jgi:hypothetical protein
VYSSTIIRNPKDRHNRVLARGYAIKALVLDIAKRDPRLAFDAGLAYIASPVRKPTGSSIAWADSLFARLEVLGQEGKANA